MKTNTYTCGMLVLCAALFWQSCVYNDQTNTFSNTVTPQPLPTVVPGFNFPEDSTVIYSWLQSQDTESITKHAWGIWAGLTANSNQIYMGDTLLIYETWLGVTDLASLCAEGDSTGGCDVTKGHREKLDFPNQLTHNFGSANTSPIDNNPGFYVSVSYDPNAACFATQNLLFNKSSIDKYAVPNGIGAIKPFTNNSITTKPTYFIGKVSDSLIGIPAWKGPADTLSRVYAPSDWNSYIYVDVNNGQEPGKVAVPVSDTTSNPPATAIVNLNEFIYYPLDSAAAAFMNTQQKSQAGSIAAGDLAILVAMHVATKEISNWTWQTFFWTTDPAKPDFPSSEWEAALRPSELNGAASHYAVSTAYAMVWPNQPITGGTNENVTPIIGYNPYLEPGLPAPFGNVNRLDSTFQYGMQTNCMTCHSLATNSLANKTLSYSADQYIDMRDSIFNNYVQLDFAWSIQNNLNKTK